MKLTIQLLQDTNCQLIVHETHDPDARIADVKNALASELGYLPSHLLCRGRLLEDDMLLSEYNITQTDIVYVVQKSC